MSEAQRLAKKLKSYSLRSGYAWHCHKAADELRRLDAEVQMLLGAVPAGYVLVPKSLIDEFPEINPSNYDHDDACALNSWGCEVVTNAIAAAPQPAAQQEPSGEPVAWLTTPTKVAHRALDRDLTFHRPPDKLDWVVQPLYTRPAVPLTDAQKQEIHNKTGAGHALICLVESYISEAAHKIEGTP